MSLCDPYLDDDSVYLDDDSVGEISLNHSHFLASTKGATDQLQRKRKKASAECFHVPVHNPDDLTETEKQFTMQGENGREGKRSLTASSAIECEFEQATAKGNFFAKNSCGGRNRFLDVAGRQSVAAIDVPLSDLAFHEDEMVSWLHYPLDDTFDRNYCTEDIFGELSNPHRIQVSKDSSHENQSSHSQHLAFSTDSNTRVPASSSSSQAVGPLGSAECSLVALHGSGRAVTADTAMALGAGRAAGLLPQAGAEAFSRVRTSVQPFLVKGPHTGVSLSYSPRDISSDGALLQPLKSFDYANPSSHSLKPAPHNFSHFSRPLAASKTSLQLVGGSSGPTNVDRVRQPFVIPTIEAAAGSCQPCAAERSATAVTGVGSSRQPDLSPKSTETRQCNGSSSLREWSLPSPLQQRMQQVDAALENEELSDRMVTSLSYSAATATERGNGTVDTADFCTTSGSRRSGNCNAEYALDNTPNSKNNVRLSEESENRSEEVEEIAANAKKPPSGRTSSSKRARAAEIHNQSERRRRDKINERMKALQELIPNANKTDKASMLDEVIEYLKMLQGQLQLMSMRTGMLAPPVMMPTGLQYLPMQQMPVLPHMSLGMGMGLGMGVGMGMGMSMGMGMGMMDVSATGPGAARAVVPLPGLPGQPLAGTAHHASGFHPSSSSLVIPEAQGALRTPQAVNEQYNLYPAQQQPQPLQVNMQANVDMYNAFMRQQKQWNPSSKPM